MWVPDVLVDGVLSGTTAQGPNVVNCGQEPFIFVAGETPASYTPGLGRTSCAVQNTPMAAE